MRRKKIRCICVLLIKGRYKPYLYKGKAYRRSDTASVEVDRIELNRLTLEGNNLYFESYSSHFHSGNIGWNSGNLGFTIYIRNADKRKCIW